MIIPEEIKNDYEYLEKKLIIESEIEQVRDIYNYIIFKNMKSIKMNYFSKIYSFESIEYYIKENLIDYNVLLLICLFEKYYDEKEFSVLDIISDNYKTKYDYLNLKKLYNKYLDLKKWLFFNFPSITIFCEDRSIVDYLDIYRHVLHYYRTCRINRFTNNISVNTDIIIYDQIYSFKSINIIDYCKNIRENFIMLAYKNDENEYSRYFFFIVKYLNNVFYISNSIHYTTPTNYTRNPARLLDDIEQHTFFPYLLLDNSEGLTDKNLQVYKIGCIEEIDSIISRHWLYLTMRKIKSDVISGKYDNIEESVTMVNRVLALQNNNINNVEILESTKDLVKLNNTMKLNNPVNDIKVEIANVDINVEIRNVKNTIIYDIIEVLETYDILNTIDTVDISNTEFDWVGTLTNFNKYLKYKYLLKQINYYLSVYQKNNNFEEYKYTGLYLKLIDDIIKYINTDFVLNIIKNSVFNKDISEKIGTFGFDFRYAYDVFEKIPTSIRFKRNGDYIYGDYSKPSKLTILMNDLTYDFVRHFNIQYNKKIKCYFYNNKSSKYLIFFNINNFKILKKLFPESYKNLDLFFKTFIHNSLPLYSGNSLLDEVHPYDLMLEWITTDFSINLVLGVCEKALIEYFDNILDIKEILKRNIEKNGK